MTRSVRLLVLLGTFAGVACREEWPTEPLTASYLEASLEKAFLSRSPRRFEEFLLEWHASIEAAAPDEIAALSDTARAAYEIFQRFWDPLNLNSYGPNEPPETGNNLYARTPYLIVQGSIRFGVGGEAYNQPLFSNFRPSVSVGDKKTSLSLRQL